MILSRGNTADLGKMYADFRGRAPTVAAMLVDRGLKEAPSDAKTPPPQDD